MSRLIRMIASFAVVLGAYWAYALAAVPLIEPAATGPQGNSGGRQGAGSRFDDRMAELQRLVPPQARSLLENPKIIESNDFKLLLQDYTNLGDGRVRVEPCVLVYTAGSSNENVKAKPPVVLCAPMGAVMLFDRPLDLRRGDVGQPVSGKLLGEITITSPGESPGTEDDLRIVTRDVQLTPERITTSNPVHFRYGASYGSGRHLLIKLLQNEERPGTKSETPDVVGIESFELRELERLHLEPAQASGAPSTATARQSGPADLDMDRPLEITCQGRFYFDPIRQYAEFKRQVDVLQLNPDGPADQLNCELLTLYFCRSRKRLVNPDGRPAPRSPLGQADAALRLREIQAKGNPVIVRAPSREAEARGELLSYDVQQERVALKLLEDNGEVFLRQGPNEIHARRIEYKSKGKGRLGEVFSQGPGWMRGEMADRPGEEFFVRWGDQLELKPFEGQHLATLNGGVELHYLGVGNLTASRIDFWLFERPAGTERKKLEVEPDRMLVQDRVTIRSPQLAGNTKLMKIWFEKAPEPAAADTFAGPAGTIAPGDPRGGNNAANQGPLAGPLQPQADDKPLERRFEVYGDQVRSRVMLREGKAELAELVLEGSVRLDEIPLVRDPEPPMHVRGDRVEVFGVQTMNTELSVIGRRAQFQGRGLAMAGTNINLNAGTNRLWIDGAGEMKLPVDRDLKGKRLARPGVLTVKWQERMNFDGQTALFEEAVTADAMNQKLQTETLEVRFAEAIRFRELQSESRPEPEVEVITCRGKVFLEGRTFKQIAVPGGAPPRFVQESWEYFEVKHMTVNRRTGELFAQGPGRMATISPQSSEILKDRAGAIRQPSRRESAADELAYMEVEFQRNLIGNIERRTATFHDQVQCIYGEAESWQTRLEMDDPDALGKKGVKLTADRLTVAEVPVPASEVFAKELEAFGNVVAENSTYFANADRITYSEAKDWLILEGDGHAEAELALQEYVGGPVKRTAARKIFFWPSIPRVSIVDGRSVEMNALLP